MKSYLLIFLILSFTLAEEELTYNDKIAVMTDANFDQVIKTHEFVIVKFFAQCTQFFFLIII